MSDAEYIFGRPRGRYVGTDLSAVITWAGLGLSAAEPHAL